MRMPRKILALVAGIALAVGVPAPAAADLAGHGGMVRSIDISPDGRRVLTGSFDFTAILWDFETQSEIARLDEHAGPVTSVQFLPGGKRALTTSDDMSAIIWDLAARKPLHRLEGHKHKVMTAAVSTDGRHIATGGWDKTVRIWDAETGELRRTIDVPVPVNAVAFIGDTMALAVGGHDPIIRLVNGSNGRKMGKLEGHRMGITQLRISGDGKRMLSASIDKTVRLWDLDDFSAVRTFEWHETPVFAAAFSPDGKSGISAGRDGFLVQWDMNQSEPVRQIKAHDTIVWAVAYSADGRFALSASSDETVRVWHLQTGDRIGEEAGGDSDEPKPWLTSEHPGAPLFKKCARCHSLSANGVRRSGPHLSGLFGRRAGSVPGYNYSSALTGVEFEWNDETLFALFDKGPDKVLPGTKMPVQRVSDSGKLTQLVEYLKQLTAPGGGGN